MGCGPLFSGDAVLSGAGFLVLWLVKREMLHILGWIFVGVWVNSRTRCCPFGGGGSWRCVWSGRECCHFGVDFRWGVVCYAAARGRVSWCVVL